MNPEEVLDNIICARAHNSEQQCELLGDAAALMSDSRYSTYYSIMQYRTVQYIHVRAGCDCKVKRPHSLAHVSYTVNSM